MCCCPPLGEFFFFLVDNSFWALRFLNVACLIRTYLSIILCHRVYTVSLAGSREFETIGNPMILRTPLGITSFLFLFALVDESLQALYKCEAKTMGKYGIVV